MGALATRLRTINCGLARTLVDLKRSSGATAALDAGAAGRGADGVLATAAGTGTGTVTSTGIDGVMTGAAAFAGLALLLNQLNI